MSARTALESRNLIQLTGNYSKLTQYYNSFCKFGMHSENFHAFSVVGLPIIFASVSTVGEIWKNPISEA